MLMQGGQGNASADVVAGAGGRTGPALATFGLS